ncbi:Calcineurin-like_phosphoesterase [Hexamita inflata]|uniref:Calcineurin-like phosphoesterase n=1 Tax=Hexamita inflata TaxID=28002 RepID=A0AA86RDG8_9EUKA|nr:Calcineurin-like phosphoesterase [Hexamita inflata]
MKILLFGCVHGRFDIVCQKIDEYKPDLAVLLGDLQTFIEEGDMDACNLKAKYRDMGHFRELLTGKLSLSCPTVCIGGNHENVKHLAAFRNGGYLCANLFYLGSGMYTVVINGRQIDIAAISGISHFPIIDSVRLSQHPFLSNDFQQRDIQFLTRACKSDLNSIPVLSTPTLVLSHDWPLGVSRLLPKSKLVTKQSNLADPRIGGPVSALLLKQIRNQNCVYCCSHMHFQTENFITVQNEPTNVAEVDWTFSKEQKRIKFIALNKVEHAGYQEITYFDSKSNKQNGVWAGEKYFGDFCDGQYRENELVNANGVWILVNGENKVVLE